MAKHDKLKLSIAKADRSTDFFILKYGSTERGKVVDVTVTDIDGVPYNLSGLDLYFVEELYNGQIVVDDGKQVNAGSFVNTDLENGQFSYQFQEAVYQYDGWAHFKLMKGENLIDTTAGFAIKIIDDVDSDLDEKSYVAYFESIKKEHQDWLDKAKEMLASAQELNDGNHSLISECKSALDALTVKHNNLQAQTDTLSQTVTNNLNEVHGRLGKLEGTQTLDSPDFNTVTATGVYHITNNTPANIKNNPAGQWGVLVVSNGNGSRISQVYYPDDGSPQWYRLLNGSNWLPWYQLSTKDDVNNAKNLANQAQATADTKANSSDVSALQNTVNSKVNVDGDLFLALDVINSWADVQADGLKNVLKSVRTGETATDFNTGSYDAGIVFGGNDTKAFISIGCANGQARVSGGNNAGVWHEDIAWKSDLGNYATKSDLGTKLLAQDVDINTLTTEGNFFVESANSDHFPTDYRNRWYFLNVAVTNDIIKQTVTPDHSEMGWTMTRTGAFQADGTISWGSWLVSDFANGKLLKI